MIYIGPWLIALVKTIVQKYLSLGTTQIRPIPTIIGFLSVECIKSQLPNSLDCTTAVNTLPSAISYLDFEVRNKLCPILEVNYQVECGWQLET